MANHPLDTTLFDKAVLFAVRAHAGTERRGKGFPYIIHPMEAAEIVATITPDTPSMPAAIEKYLKKKRVPKAVVA